MNKMRRIKAKTARAVCAVSMTTTALIGTIFIVCFVPHLTFLYDGAMLRSIAEQTYTDHAYLAQYPFNIPLMLFFRLLHLIFGNTAVAFAVFNLLCALLLQFALVDISRRIFKKRNITTMVAIGITLFVPIYFYVVQLYGDLAGAAFSIAAIDLLLAFRTVKTRRILCMVGFFMCVTISILFKSSLVVLWATAAVFFGIYVLFKRRNVKTFAMVAAAFALALVVNAAIVFIFNIANVSSEKIAAYPKTAWVAMGLKYGDRSDVDLDSIKAQPIAVGSWAPGVVNDEFALLTEKFPDNAARQNEFAIEQIKKELKTFIDNPIFAINFFTQKVVSTWNNQSFESPDRLGYEISNSAGSASALFDNGSRVNSVLKYFEKILQLVVYVGVIIFYVSRLKRKRTTPLAVYLLSIIFLAGFGLSLIWETMSRSVLIYFLLLVPMAATGYFDLSNGLVKVLSSYHKISPIFFRCGRKSNN
jgi:hypothetical protein